MLKITDELAETLLDVPNIGFFGHFGAVIGDAEFIVCYKNGDSTPYLAHVSEFEQIGLTVKLKDNKN